MQNIVLGMLAHVDAGKTTLSEALLYQAGSIRKLGRVDHKDAFLDTHAIEKERGITIFSKQASFAYKDTKFILLDTPGHVDFSPETERTLSVLDYAVLVISGTDGVQAHTRTLWRLLKIHRIPVFVFVNKMDIAQKQKDEIIKDLEKELGTGFVDFTLPQSELFEACAMCSEKLMQSYLENSFIDKEEIKDAVFARRIFPAYFGSALKTQGTEEFLDMLSELSYARSYSDDFGARVFKITEDSGTRLTWMKITGGSLTAKDMLTNASACVSKEDVWEEKADQIRIYSGDRFIPAKQAQSGEICAVSGLTKTYPGQGLGKEASEIKSVLKPVLAYELSFPGEKDLQKVYSQIKKIEDEDPSLDISWDAGRKAIRANLMGEVQKEVLLRILKDRFSLDAVLSDGKILYKETVSAAATGIGHYEPLRHFAHVQLMIEPIEEGRGIELASAVSEDVLARNWQRLILTHLAEKQHLGVLTGSPLTDVRITITGGMAHNKHTEGGDFREATYRAVRMALMCAQNVLLEPYYAFRMEIPADCVGRAMTDIKRMEGEFETPEINLDKAVIKGFAPVSEMNGYAREMISYTKGAGDITLESGGYRPCRNAAAVIENIGYDPEADTANTPDSVFCSHGAGYLVKWHEVAETLKQNSFAAQTKEERSFARSASKDSEEELLSIYERTYGPLKDRAFLNRHAKPSAPQDTKSMVEMLDPKQNYLLVDGYNMIFSWKELKSMARESISLARETLIRMLVNYQAINGINLILVFDAYKVSGGKEKIEKEGGVYIVYTKEAEIADVYIERITHELKDKKGIVKVATSDGLEQLIIMGKGALRVTANELYAEVAKAENEISGILSEMRDKNKGTYRIWQKITSDN